jgi:hypothetical protein
MLLELIDCISSPVKQRSILKVNVGVEELVGLW